MKKFLIRINPKNIARLYKTNRSLGDNRLEAFYYALRGKVFAIQIGSID
jgi:hypothetical protein